MSILLEHIIVDPPIPAQASVIWFHGLGADGRDFLPLLPQLALPENLGLRFIFPHAPVIPVSINGGYAMPAWFDILSLAPKLIVDETGLTAAIRAANDLIDTEIAKGIPAERIFIAGFSQGGALALCTALTQPQTLGGVIALSTFIPSSRITSFKQKPLPIFMAHGHLDDVVPLPLGEQTYQTLKTLGYNIDWHSYRMTHEVCQAEVTDLSEWLQMRLN